MVTRLEEAQKAAPLFAGWQETMIWSCLQGVMGDIYVLDKETPGSAAARLGDFCFFAGKPEKELALYQPPGDMRDFMIMVPQDEAWEQLIAACWGEHAKRVMRYAIKKEDDVFDRARLQRIAEGLSSEYTLRVIDKELYEQCLENRWTRDLVAQFDSYEAYRNHGLGVVALQEGRIVSGASSYSAYREGIEIEIDTHVAYRRRGLALACGAKLILSCLERGLYPSWDAQNLGSVALAEKLGYHADHAYPVFEVSGCARV